MPPFAGLSVHLNQVHKETLDHVENALPNRQGLDVEIFGMEGIPADILDQHRNRIIQNFYQAQEDRRVATGNPLPGQAKPPKKKLKMETPEELKARLADHRAKVAAAKAAGLPHPGISVSPAAGAPANASPGAFVRCPLTKSHRSQKKERVRALILPLFVHRITPPTRLRRPPTAPRPPIRSSLPMPRPRPRAPCRRATLSPASPAGPAPSTDSRPRRCPPGRTAATSRRRLACRSARRTRAATTTADRRASPARWAMPLIRSSAMPSSATRRRGATRRTAAAARGRPRRARAWSTRTRTSAPRRGCRSCLGMRGCLPFHRRGSLVREGGRLAEGFSIAAKDGVPDYITRKTDHAGLAFFSCLATLHGTASSGCIGDVTCA